jgi:hypothetical protein
MKAAFRLLLIVGCLALASCASSSQQSLYNAIDMIPHWAGGEPPGIPPRPGTPEYEAYQARRAQEAARPKDSSKPAS